LRSAMDALSLSRKLPEKRFLAKALSVVAEIHVMNQKPAESLKAGKDSLSIYRDCEEQVGEAFSHVICAHAHLMMGKNDLARTAATNALSIFQDADNELGEDMAMRVLEHLESVEEHVQKENMLQMQVQTRVLEAQPVAALQGQEQVQTGMSKAQGETAIRPRAPGSGALALNSLTLDAVKSKVMETTLAIIDDEEEVEGDTPLLEAGLTSNTAVLLRDELARDIPGITLPPTLIFDYPSVNAMSEFIIEKCEAVR